MPANGDAAHRLNDRARGWLRFLWQKATTPDDWSEDGVPHPWWDRYSTEPMMNFPRFDLSESSYAVGIMADVTPAWREVHGRILEELAERHLTYWAAVDWLTQFGEDPKRAEYPEAWKGFLIPEHLFGKYDTPGWTANGAEPWGLQADPIGAEGNLFFKGWLNLTMSLHHYVSGEAKWDHPFEVAGIDRSRFEWTQPRLAEHLATLWSRHPAGLHCENTKVWPFCLSAAGLGLQMHDTLSGQSTHGVAESWLDYAKQNYFGVDDKGALRWTTFYYDPLLDEHMRHGPSDALPTSLYLLPQEPSYAEFLYHAAVTRLGWNDPGKPTRAPADPRFLALGLALAKEWGDDTTVVRLHDYAEAHFEPRAFGANGDEFGWWFGFGEDWPRGQMSALMIMSEVGGPGAWRRLFREPNLSKFDAPTVEGVDFPSLGIAQAWNDPAEAVLHVETYAADSSRKGGPTQFSITNLPDAALVDVHCGADTYGRWRATGDHSIEVESEIADRVFRITTGYRGAAIGSEKTNNATVPPINSGGATTLPAGTSGPAASIIAPPPACPCCVPAAT